jgi:hypothetical protein
MRPYSRYLPSTTSTSIRSASMDDLMTHGAGRCRFDYDQGTGVGEDSLLFEVAGLTCAQT